MSCITPALKFTIMLTWQLSQQSPWAQADPLVNLQVAASQQSFLHSCMKRKQRNAMLTTTLQKTEKNGQNIFIQKINEVVTWRVCTKKFSCLCWYSVYIRIYWLSDLKCVCECVRQPELYLWFATVTLLSLFQPAIATFSNTNHIWWQGLVFQTHASSTLNQCLKVFSTAAAESGGTTTR